MRHLLQGALTLHISELFAMRLTGVVGLHQGAMQAAPTSLENPGLDVTGNGLGAVLTVPFGQHGLMLSADLGVISIPSYVEVFCDPPTDDLCLSLQENKHDRDPVLWSAASAGYAYRFNDRLRVQLSFVLQNHPTNREQFYSSSTDAEVQDGPLYVTSALVVEWQPTDWLGIAPAVQWPLVRSPIEYGPIVGLGVRGIVPGSMRDL